VLEIKVNELPESCWFCDYSATSFDDEPICVAKQVRVFPVIDLKAETRPEWCPLVVEESPEDRWKRQTLNNGNVCVNCDGDGWDRCMELTCEWCKGTGKYVEEDKNCHCVKCDPLSIERFYQEEE